MKAVRLEAVGKLTLRDLDRPDPGPGELLVKVEAAGICGSDRHFFDGGSPTVLPVTLGHEISGVVEVVGHDVAGFRRNDRVTVDPNVYCGRCRPCTNGRVNLCTDLKAFGIHLDGGLADYVVVPHKQAFILPASLSPLSGAMCEPLACALHAVDTASIPPGASVVVIGGGVIGLLVVQLARMAGATKVVLVTRQAFKRELASLGGATDTFDPTVSQFLDWTTGPRGVVPGGADVVFECAGTPETFRQALNLVGRGGTVVTVGLVPQGMMVEVEPFDILYRELRILASYINPFVHRRAADLLATGAVDVSRLISRTISLEETVDAISHPARSSDVKVVAVPS